MTPDRFHNQRVVEALRRAGFKRYAQQRQGMNVVIHMRDGFSTSVGNGVVWVGYVGDDHAVKLAAMAAALRAGGFHVMEVKSLGQLQVRL